MIFFLPTLREINFNYALFMKSLLKNVGMFYTKLGLIFHIIETGLT